VDNVGGSISVNTAPGHGVSYEIIIPSDHDEKIIPANNEAVVKEISLQAERVLTKASKKQRLSSSWQIKKMKVAEENLLDISSYLLIKTYVEREIVITADEQFIYQLIGSYGLSMKYKGSNLSVMNEALCMFIDEVVSKTVDSLKNDRQKVENNYPVIMSRQMFGQVLEEKEVIVSELLISEGCLKIMVIEN